MPILEYSTINRAIVDFPLRFTVIFMFRSNGKETGALLGHLSYSFFTFLYPVFDVAYSQHMNWKTSISISFCSLEWV